MAQEANLYGLHNQYFASRYFYVIVNLKDLDYASLG